MDQSKRKKLEEKAALLRKLATLQQKLAGKKRALERKAAAAAGTAAQFQPRPARTSTENSSYPKKRRKIEPTPATPSSSLPHVSTTKAQFKDREESTEPGENNALVSRFAWDYSKSNAKAASMPTYDEIPEPEGIPCSNWPNCKYYKTCKFTHPSHSFLRSRRGRAPTPSDISGLVTRFKNNTVSLKTLYSLLSNRVLKSAKFCGLKSPTVTRDSILATMGLPGVRTILMNFNKASKTTGALNAASGGGQGTSDATKQTSHKDFHIEHGGYFAILKLGKEFLIRYYPTRGPGSKEVSRKQESESGAWRSNPRSRLHPSDGPFGKVSLSDRPLIQFREEGKMTEAEMKAALAEPSSLSILDSDPIRSQNKGYSMLLALGWREGHGLGSRGQGVSEPLIFKFTLSRSCLR